jgi:hypothetical protein
MCLARLYRKRPVQQVAIFAIVLAFLCTTAILAVFVWQNLRLFNDVIASVAYSMIVYWGFATFYFHLFNTSETARRIKLLYEIDKAGSLSETKITDMYSTNDIVRLRLKRLVDTNQLRLRDGNYSIDNRLLYFAALIVAFWQRVLGMPYTK